MQQYSFSDCFTYSPNWYIEGAVCLDPFLPHTLYYASNSLVFAYNLITRRVTSEFQCRHILKQKGHLSHDILDNTKALTILPLQNYIVIGLNEGVKITIHRETKATMVHQHKLKNILVMFPLGASEVVLVDEVGTCVTVTLNQEPQIVVKVSNKKTRCKKIIRLGNYCVLFYLNGDIHLFDQDFSKEIRKLHWFKNQSILSIDNIDQQILVLSRTNDEIYITYFEFSYGHHFLLEHTKTAYEIAINLHRCPVSLNYPKKFQYKREEMKKASLNVKWVTETRFLLSGKLGELYLFDLGKLAKQQSRMQLHAYSNMEEETAYSVISTSQHFSDIYAIYRRDKQMITVGTDRNMTFWSIKESRIFFEYQERFLASKVNCVFRSEGESNMCFLLMHNSVMRSWDVEEHMKGESILSEYWKLGNKVKVEKVCACPTEEGIIAVLTDQHRVVIYDLYDERFVREYEFGDDVQHLRFLSPDNLKHLVEFLQHQPYQIHPIGKQLFKKTFPEGVYLSVCDKNYISILDLHNKTCKRLGNFFKDMGNTEFVEDFFFDKGIIVSTVKSPTTFNLYVSNKLNLKYSFEEVYASHRYYIRILSQSRVLVALWKGKDIQLLLLDIEAEIKFLCQKTCHFNYHINYCQLSPNGKKMLCYSSINSTLQVWDIVLGENSISTVSRNIKAHQGYVIGATFLDSRLAISYSQDHDVKIWDVESAPERAPPKGKKTKKKRKMEISLKEQGSDSSEDQIGEVKQLKE